jgi:PST family polysaccharide transporter
MDRFRTAFYACTRISSAIAVPVFTMLAVSAPVLVPLVFGEQWEPAVIVMQFMAALGIINSVAYFDRSALLALDRGRAALGIAAGQGVLNVVIALFTAPIGIGAMAAGVMARQYLFWPVRLWTLRRAMQLDIRKYFAQWGSAVVVAIAVGAATGFALVLLQDSTDLERMAVATCAAAVAYLLGLRFAAPSTYAELRELAPPLPRPLRVRKNVT